MLIFIILSGSYVSSTGDMAIANAHVGLGGEDCVFPGSCSLWRQECSIIWVTQAEWASGEGPEEACP
jgi:hypothetical protein